ncbi:MAG: hypothetical protein NTW60_00925 [Candidatus Wolfebacteria bacterium]|nr:hypothetical protein [Candidatus Wolfebacteria bacterium]
MNTKIIILLIIAFSVGVLTTALAAPVPGTIPSAGDLGIQQDSPIKDVPGAVAILTTVVKWLYTIFFIAAAFFLLLAAFKYLTGGHTPANVQMAHKMILYAAIAIVVAFMSVGFESIIKNFLSPNSNTSNSFPANGTAQNYGESGLNANYR